MPRGISRFVAWVRAPIQATTWRRFHGIMTMVWAMLITPTVLLWHSSILWVALMSVWANMATHFGAYQAARSEVASEDSAT